MGRVMLAGLLSALLAGPAAAAGPPRLDGVWLFESATVLEKDNLQVVWGSAAVVAGDKVRVTDFFGSGKPLTGAVLLDPKSPGTADVDLAEFDLSPLGFPAKIDAGVRKAAYTLTGDRLTVVVAREVGGPRPAASAKSKDVLRLALVRAPVGVTGPPKRVAVTVTAADGSPAAGVKLTTYMHRTDPPVVRLPRGAKPPADLKLPKGMVVLNEGDPDPKRDPDAPAADYGVLATTGADGVADVPYDELTAGVLVAHDPKRRQIAVRTVTPAGLGAGKVAMTLSNECRVTVPAACPDLDGAGRPIGLNSYIYKDGVRFMFAGGAGTTLEFLAPAGDYTVGIYGKDIVGKSVKLSVPADGRSAFTAPAVELKPNNMARLRGKPAPELAGVVGYHGAPFKLADFKGKYVVVDFWGYWCNPCTEAMPALFAVHDHFPGEVVVVTVHQDGDGEIKTAAELDAKLGDIKKKQWAGRDLPLRTALISGRDDGGKAGGAAADYGVNSWPTTILIGPDGKVVGDVHFRDPKTAVGTMSALMGKPPVEPAPKDKP